jgi:hypothetical protein
VRERIGRDFLEHAGLGSKLPLKKGISRAERITLGANVNTEMRRWCDEELRVAMNRVFSLGGRWGMAKVMGYVRLES